MVTHLNFANSHQDQLPEKFRGDDVLCAEEMVAVVLRRGIVNLAVSPYFCRSAQRLAAAKSRDDVNLAFRGYANGKVLG